MGVVNEIPLQAVVHNSYFSLDKAVFNLKPRGGSVSEPRKALWTSKYETPIDNMEWVHYCRTHKNYNKGSHTCLWKLYPKETFNLKVYKIDSLDDYLSKELSKLDTKDSNMSYPEIDYEEMNRLGYHGVWFTGNITKFKYKDINKLGNLPVLMYSKIRDSIVWFTTDWIGEIELVTDKLFD